jgi:hypothetical protein
VNPNLKPSGSIFPRRFSHCLDNVRVHIDSAACDQRIRARPAASSEVFSTMAATGSSLSPIVRFSEGWSICPHAGTGGQTKAATQPINIPPLTLSTCPVM